MQIEFRDLTEETLASLPEWNTPPYSCKYCLYWESDALDPSAIPIDCQSSFQRKLSWLKKTRQTFGNCGQIACIAGTVVGYAQYAPAKFLPTCKEYPTGPPTDDAILLSCLFLWDKDHRNVGIGSLLLTRILKDLGKRGMVAVETFARKDNPQNPSGPDSFYRKHGFRTLREGEFLLMRKELMPRAETPPPCL